MTYTYFNGANTSLGDSAERSEAKLLKSMDLFSVYKLASPSAVRHFTVHACRLHRRVGRGTVTSGTITAPRPARAHVLAEHCASTLLACALLACATGALGGGVAPHACADVSPADMMKQTSDTLPNCALAKVLKLCAIDPVKAAMLCPVTCACGAGFSTVCTNVTHCESCDTICG